MVPTANTAGKIVHTEGAASGNTSSLKTQAIDQPAAEHVADDAAEAEGGQGEGNPAGIDAGDFQQGRRHVAEHAEHAGEADGADRQGQPDLRPIEGADLVQRAVSRLVAVERQEQRHQQHRQQGDGADQGERVAPAQPLPEPGGQRVADQDRHSQAHQHPRHGLGALVRPRGAGR